MGERHIAVVGGGISGLGAAWLLSRRYRVTLFEASDRAGGHTNTVDCATRGGDTAVDTGFIVYNRPNYPHLSALFDHLEVATHPSDMSFGFSARDGDFEYAGDGLSTLFAQRRNLLRREFLGMVGDILRFNRAAGRALDQGMPEEQTLGEFLAEMRAGEAFRGCYLLPMSAAIWSCPQSEMLAFPASRFLQFFRNHGLIQLTGRPAWRTVVGGGREYVRRMLPAIGSVRTGMPVSTIRRDPDSVSLIGRSGHLGRFDDVVIATHADQALAIIERPGFWERRLLGAFRYQQNDAWLHEDPSLMPRRRAVWSSWNHVSRDAEQAGRAAAVTYWMNRLQPLTTDSDLFVTLNPAQPPAASRVYRHISYHHPVFDHAAVRAQGLMRMIQGRDRLWFCGSYLGYGFHEDGLRSGMEVANRLGVAAPWQRPEAARAVDWTSGRAPVEVAS